MVVGSSDPGELCVAIGDSELEPSVEKDISRRTSKGSTCWQAGSCFEDRTKRRERRDERDFMATSGVPTDQLKHYVGEIRRRAVGWTHLNRAPMLKPIAPIADDCR
jgi:hypothetical protein